MRAPSLVRSSFAMSRELERVAPSSQERQWGTTAFAPRAQCHEMWQNTEKWLQVGQSGLSSRSVTGEAAVRVSWGWIGVRRLVHAHHRRQGPDQRPPQVPRFVRGERRPDVLRDAGSRRLRLPVPEAGMDGGGGPGAQQLARQRGGARILATLLRLDARARRRLGGPDPAPEGAARLRGHRERRALRGRRHAPRALVAAALGDARRATWTEIRRAREGDLPCVTHDLAVGRGGSAVRVGEPRHEPVMVEEVLRLLAPKPAGRYLDLTLGGGGHARRVLERAPESRLVGVDRDATTLQRASEGMRDFGGRFTALQSRFDVADQAATAAGLPDFEASFDGILLDLGMSSLQLDDPARGFSFDADGPLDMRMDRSVGETAAELIDRLSEQEIADLLFRSGGETRS